MADDAGWTAVRAVPAATYRRAMKDVPAAANAMAILRHLATQPSPVSAATLAASTGLPRSTTYQLLATMEAQGFVTHYPEERRYGLGFAAYELGAGYTRQLPLQRVARLPIAALRERVGHSVHLSVLHGREVVYLIEERPPGGPTLVTGVGVRLPAVRTASGRAMLARMSAAQVRASLAAHPGLDRGEGRARLGELREELRLVRQRGYAEERGEVTPGLSSVAVAVTDHQDQPIASVAITFPEEQPQPVDALVAHARRTTTELSRRLGQRRPASARG